MILCEFITINKIVFLWIPASVKEEGRSPSSRSLPDEREIIELQDVRLMSPIAPIRGRRNGAGLGGSGQGGQDDPARFPPSFRMARSPSVYHHHHPGLSRATGLRYRGHKGTSRLIPIFFMSIQESRVKAEGLSRFNSIYSSKLTNRGSCGSEPYFFRYFWYACCEM